MTGPRQGLARLRGGATAQRGMSLVELLVALGLAGVGLSALALMSTGVLAAFDADPAAAEQQQRARATMAAIVEDLTRAGAAFVGDADVPRVGRAGDRARSVAGRSLAGRRCGVDARRHRRRPHCSARPPGVRGCARRGPPRARASGLLQPGVADLPLRRRRRRHPRRCPRCLRPGHGARRDAAAGHRPDGTAGAGMARRHARVGRGSARLRSARRSGDRLAADRTGHRRRTSDGAGRTSSSDSRSNGCSPAPCPPLASLPTARQNARPSGPCLRPPGSSAIRRGRRVKTARSRATRPAVVSPDWPRSAPVPSPCRLGGSRTVRGVRRRPRRRAGTPIWRASSACGCVSSWRWRRRGCGAHPPRPAIRVDRDSDRCRDSPSRPSWRLVASRGRRQRRKRPCFGGIRAGRGAAVAGPSGQRGPRRGAGHDVRADRECGRPGAGAPTPCGRIGHDPGPARPGGAARLEHASGRRTGLTVYRWRARGSSVGDVTVDLQAETARRTCGRPTACDDASTTAIADGRPWGARNPRWRLFVHVPVSQLDGAAAAVCPCYLVA